METFEVKIKEETFKISRNSEDYYSFSVFNYASFHIIRKNDFGIWKDVEHRFGNENIPIDEIGEAIDKHYSPGAVRGFANL